MSPSLIAIIPFVTVFAGGCVLDSELTEEDGEEVLEDDERDDAPEEVPLAAIAGPRQLVKEFDFPAGFYGIRSGNRLNVDPNGCPSSNRSFDPGLTLQVPDWRPSARAPVWRYGEIYSSRFLSQTDGSFVPGTSNQAYRFQNPAKSITFGGPGYGLSLKTVGAVEYNNVWIEGSSDVCVGRPHAHLMISQDITSSPLADLKSLKLSAVLEKGAMRLSSSVPGYDRRKHAMHYRINLILQNRCPDASCGRGQKVNLGFLIYDNRYTSNPGPKESVEDSTGALLLRPDCVVHGS